MSKNQSCCLPACSPNGPGVGLMRFCRPGTFGLFACRLCRQRHFLCLSLCASADRTNWRRTGAPGILSDPVFGNFSGNVVRGVQHAAYVFFGCGGGHPRLVQIGQLGRRRLNMGTWKVSARGPIPIRHGRQNVVRPNQSTVVRTPFGKPPRATSRLWRDEGVHKLVEFVRVQQELNRA